MTVAGCHATVINKSGKSADVRPFSKDCSKIQVPDGTLMDDGANLLSTRVPTNKV